MGDKGESGGAGGVKGRRKTLAPQGSAGGIDPAEREARTYASIPGGPAQKAFLEQLWEKHSDMTEDQEDALKLYKANGFKEMNALLREPEKWDEYMEQGSQGLTDIGKENRKQLFREMTAALQSAPTKALGVDTTLFRGLDFPAVGRGENALRDLIFDGLSNGTLIGAQFTDKGFGSTSLSATASNFQKVQLRIRAPKETKVWSPDPNGTNGYEQEVLLKPNTTYTIRSTSTGVFGNLILEVDID